MNKENLHELIRRYKENYAEINNETNEEIFKWKAVKCFQDAWYSEERSNWSFSQLFSKAIKESSVLINNKITHPANGVVKVAELEEEEVKHLFLDLLFAEDGGNLDLRQTHMECFEDEFNRVMAKHFPGSFKYKQERHAVSCYLALYKPEENYIYKCTPVENFAKYIEFGKDIGSGNKFSLANYYEMCDMVVKALREHTDLLEAYRKLLTDEHYHDESLHLLAFDVIYCATAYGFFTGLQHKSKKESIKAYTLEQQRKAEAAKRQKEIDELEKKIQAMELQLDEYRSINLVGVQVQEKKYGTGIIVEQNVNAIKVRFGEEIKPYTIHKQYMWRPKFEDDAEIVEAMTEYAFKMNEVKELYKKLDLLAQN